MAKKINWGIMGCGGIAGKFADDLPLTQYGQLAAVASRSPAKANKFAAHHKAARAYGSYEQLVADPNVDIIYVATPHPWHMDNTLLAIEHGKHVLCEKPMAINAKQTRRMIAAATLGTSSRVHLRHEARIFGTKGMITIHDGFFHPSRMTLEVEGKKPKTVHLPHPGIGMHFEAEHVHHCLKQEKLQSDLMPLEETLAIMQTLDKIRLPWKLKYANE